MCINKTYSSDSDSKLETAYNQVSEYSQSSQSAGIVKYFKVRQNTKMVAMWRFGLYLLVLGVVLGCQRSDDFPLAPVSGVVTLDGQPLANGCVTFQPKSGSAHPKSGLGSMAVCDEQGRYTLATIDGRPGAVVGTHRVAIYSADSNSKADMSNDDIGAAQKELIPPRYNYRSKLTLDVAPAGTDQADFELFTRG